MAVADLIRMAYVVNAADTLLNISRIEALQKVVRGGPSWMYSDWYTIEAKAPDGEVNGEARTLSDPASKKMMGPMLRRLLEDRFQLKIHTATEETPVYALTVSKGGLKIHSLDAGACIPLDRTKPISRPGPGEKPICGASEGGVNGTDKTWAETGVTFDLFARVVLTRALGRLVIDKTGMSGLYSFRLEYAPDDMTSTAPADTPTEVSAVSPGPSLFTALQQLGLKLELTKATHSYIVIDHVERPSEN